MYSYATERPWLFTDEGQRAFLAFRDKAMAMLGQTGAFTLGHAMSWMSGVSDSWKMIALVDRMVEVGDIVCLHRDGYASQSQVYAKP